MPTRSLHSSVMRWPDRDAVDAAVRAWAARQSATHPELVRIGYFGSYATGDWGVGSDLDLVVVVREATRPFAARACDWDPGELPVSADILVYTAEEFDTVVNRGDRFAGVMSTEVIWVFG